MYEQTLVRNQIVSGTGYRFLDGYIDDESQFKALMDAGIAYAKQHGIALGVTLTAEQAASLTSDMVWLVKDVVMVEGKPVEVIYPKVYLKQSDRLQLHTDGTLMSANALVMNAKESIRNEGVIQGKTVILATDKDIINSGHINAEKVGLQSDTTIYQQGQVVGRDAVELQAKENVTVNNSIEHLTNQDVLHKTAGIAVTGDTGVMIVSAGNDVNLGGATIEALGKEGAITITAGRNINSTTDTLTAKKDMTQDGDNYLRTYRQTELGTTIEAGGDISIGAKHDIKARNLTVSSDTGAVKVIGEHDVSIENGYSESKDAFALKYKEKGLLNKKETKIKTNDESTNALMSTLSGHTVVVGANNDVTLTSSNIVSTAGTTVLAGHNVITDAAAEHTLSTASKDVKKSGIMGAGMGIMIGKKQSKDNYYIDETTHKATTLGSTDGEVTVQAGDTVHLTTTDIIADKGIRLSGQDIVLDGKEDHYLSKESHEYKSSGLTVSLGGSVANAINTAYGLQQKAKGREDKRLAALEYMEAGKELKTAAANIHDYTSYTVGSVLKKGTELKELGQAQLTSAQELKNASLMNRYANTATANVADYKTKVGEANISKGNAELADLENDKAGYKAKKRAKADNLVNIRVSIGSSSSRSESSYEANTFDGGSIESNGDITIEANSADSIKGNIKAIGKTISGKTVKLVASNDVSLQAATNTSEKLENAKSKGWSVGANISVTGGGILGFDASANAAKQKSNTKVTTHTGTTVVGSDAVAIISGKDTHISGSKVIGKSVTADVGGNLSIESLQDIKTYVGESSNKGFSVSTNAGSLSNVSMSSSNGKMESDYASVTDQAGIYAGDGGFVINTAETTSLTGAVIDSTADSNKNKLSTKSLDVKDVENTAEYTSRNLGMSYNHVGNFKNLSKAGKDAVWNTLGTLPNLLPDSSKSSSSTTKSAISNGTIEVRDANFNMQTLSRDTNTSLNKLDEIFDKKKIEERQELSKVFAKEAFGQLHNWNPTSKEGKAAKAIAHGVVAEISARMAGNKPGSGFYAGATNEALIGEIQKIAKEKPDVAQTLSALLGAAVNGSLGYSSVTGAAEAQYGTKWNQYLTTNPDTIYLAKKYLKKKNGESLSESEVIFLLGVLRNIAEKDSDKAKSWKIMSESYWDLSHWENFLISYGNLSYQSISDFEHHYSLLKNEKIRLQKELVKQGYEFTDVVTAKDIYVDEDRRALDEAIRLEKEKAIDVNKERDVNKRQNIIHYTAKEAGMAFERNVLKSEFPVLTVFFEKMRTGNGSMEKYNSKSILAKTIAQSKGINDILVSLRDEDFDKDTNSVLKRIDINFAKTEKGGGWSDLGASVGRMAIRLKVIRHGDYYDVRLLGFDRSNYEYKEDASDISNKWIRWANNFFYDLQQQGLITPFSFEVTSNFYFNKATGKVYTK